MLKQGQYQKLLQKLSPQQIQLMKLLQVPTAQLEERIKEELEVNPALEEGNKEEDVKSSDDNQQESELTTPDDDFQGEETSDVQDDSPDINDYMGDDDDPADYKLKDNNYPEDNSATRGMPIPVQRTFQEFLENQLGMLDLDEHQHIIAEQIIGNIDDDGYLRRPLDAVVDDIAFSVNEETTVEELQFLLDKIHQFDPPGIGARDLKECLLIQLHKKEDHIDVIDLAKKVISDHFDEFIKKHYDKLQKHLNIDDDTFRKVINEITHLNPKPGSAFNESSQPQSFIVPDFFINNIDGKLELSLNVRNAPELRISEQYKEMMREYDKGSKKDKQKKEAIMFIKNKIDSAKWFIDAIQQRYHTLLSTMQCIMEHQYEYFLTGDETKLHPMILKDIAEKIGLDISTVSRVANSKFVQTEFGTFRLKSFFSESLTTDSGEEVSTREVKKILTDFIEGENKLKPLSDEKLTDLLNEKGYNIARRTVAKYREQLEIPVARLRKQL